jgi:hypothetical protein
MWVLAAFGVRHPGLLMEVHRGVGGGGESVNCTVRDENKSVTGYTGRIKCPDPKVVCGLFRFEKTLPMPIRIRDPTGVGSHPTGGLSGTLATAVAVVVIATVVGVIIWWRLHRRSDSSSKRDYSPH